jgi:hypothetical protein
MHEQIVLDRDVARFKNHTARVRDVAKLSAVVGAMPSRDNGLPAENLRKTSLR